MGNFDEGLQNALLTKWLQRILILMSFLRCRQEMTSFSDFDVECLNRSPRRNVMKVVDKQTHHSTWPAWEGGVSSLEAVSLRSEKNEAIKSHQVSSVFSSEHAIRELMRLEGALLGSDSISIALGGNQNNIHCDGI